MISFDSDRRTPSGTSRSRSDVQNLEETGVYPPAATSPPSVVVLKGMSLAEWLDRGHCPSVELVLRIGREIAAGLSAAHRH